MKSPAGVFLKNTDEILISVLVEVGPVLQQSPKFKVVALLEESLFTSFTWWREGEGAGQEPS